MKARNFSRLISILLIFCILFISSELDYWTGLYFTKDNLITSSHTIYCNGAKYTGQYKKSIVDKLNSFETDVYYDDKNIEFGIHGKTGELVYINLMNAVFFETEPYLTDVNNPAKTALSVAQKIVQEYVPDIDEYEVLIEEPDVQYKEKEGNTYQISYHVITFARKVQGYFSSDYISVKVTSKGNLASIKMGDIGIFKSMTSNSNIDLASKSINTKLQETYDKTGYKLVKPTVVDQKIAMTPNGELCLYTKISVSLEDQSRNEITSGIVTLTTIG